MQGKLSELIFSYSEPYKKRLTQSPSDAREYTALVDFYIKVALTLLAVYSKRSSAEIKLGATPGVGEMLSGIKIAKKWIGSQDPVINGWGLFSEGFLSEFSVNIYDGKSFKVIRDELSHGSPLPADEGLADKLCEALREFSEAVSLRLQQQLEKFTYSVSGPVFHAICADDKQELNPVWDVNETHGVVGFYSSFDTDGVYYLCPDVGSYRNVSPDNTQRFEGGFLKKTLEDQHHGKFVYEITRDIAGFSEDRSSPPYSFGEGEHAGVVFVTWTQPSLQGNTHRTDAFRRGQDNRYEWLDHESQSWLGFTSFLRKITNWKILARRIRIELDEQERRKQIAETGSAQAVSNVKIDTILLGEQNSDDSESHEINVQERADRASVPSKSFTSVFFVVGDAGMGKTEHLLGLARDRARLVEEEGSEAPLYLFVSSAGRALSNLDDAINTSLSITRILDSQSAKILCKNGLLVLIVDGFDELLGSSGYDNPLGSLEGWFRDLRGRGVMIASARSSYYMTRYRRSLSEVTNLNVEHVIANIQPWGQENIVRFLKSCGVEQDCYKDLSNRDWKLLSIPFFAKAFATWCTTSSSEVAVSGGIFEVVVGQYLERESKKILDQNNSPILSLAELQVLFSEFAEMMHFDGKFELEQSELEDCASMALEVDDLDKFRPGLKRRLSSLCGLSVGDVVVGNNSFGFAHEVVFDCFLSLSLQRRCKSSLEAKYIAKFFGSAPVNPAVIEWFVSSDIDSARRALNLLLQARIDSPIWAKNVGNLWTTLLNESSGMPPNMNASGLVLGTVEVSKGDGTTLMMVNSQVDHLCLMKGGAVVNVDGAKIDYVEVDENATLTRLKNITPEMIQRLRTPDSYNDNTISIRAVLEQSNAIAKQSSAAAQEWLDTANYFITELVYRPDAPIVVFEDGFEPDGERLGWTRRLGLAKWVEFLQRLTQCNLASWDRIVSAGAPKVRLVFKVAPAEIERRNFKISNIENFWSVH